MAALSEWMPGGDEGVWTSIPYTVLHELAARLPELADEPAVRTAWAAAMTSVAGMLYNAAAPEIELTSDEVYLSMPLHVWLRLKRVYTETSGTEVLQLLASLARGVAEVVCALDDAYVAVRVQLLDMLAELLPLGYRNIGRRGVRIAVDSALGELWHYATAASVVGRIVYRIVRGQPNARGREDNTNTTFKEQNSALLAKCSAFASAVATL